MEMTSLPASVVHLDRKGSLQKGKDADILIFDPEDIRENATYENPKQYGSGFRRIFVGGKEIKIPEN